MKYKKSALSFEEQADLLIRRGLIINNREELINYLKQVNYYRLSGYWYFFKLIDPESGEEKFKPDTSMEKIRVRYEFDRDLKMLLMDAIEKIEVCILRTRLVENISQKYGPFGYTDLKNYSPKFDRRNFYELMTFIYDNEKESDKEFIKRYHNKYDEEIHLPIWMAVELMTFGELLTLYRNQTMDVKREIASGFDLEATVLSSWLHTLLYIRNACAHHARLWDRPMSIPPKIPDEKNDPRWHAPVKLSNQNIFIVLTLTNYLMFYINPAYGWADSMKRLMEKYPTLPIKPMGFPSNWQEVPFWA